MTLFGYASRTGTTRNLDALRAAGWGLMISATGSQRNEGFTSIALDNGAWTAHQSGKAFDERAFLKLLDRFADEADFVVIPDIVNRGPESLAFSLGWIERLRDCPALLLLPVQNGVTPDDIRPYVGRGIGLFIGGDSAWKERTMGAWGALARRVSCYMHVGRVNTAFRLKLCGLAGADSFDGTSASRFAETLPFLDGHRNAARLQGRLSFMTAPAGRA